jgi:RNA-directed DNA polymerase
MVGGTAMHRCKSAGRNAREPLQNCHTTRGCRRNYFGFCETPEGLVALTRWVRLRLRAALWRQWKTPRRRRAALIANGASPWAARNTAGSGRGPWYLARSRALSTGLSNAYFKSLGLPSLFQAC